MADAMIDEWDEGFLNEAIEAMEAVEAFSSARPPPPPPLASAPRLPPPSPSPWSPAFPAFPSHPPGPSTAAFNFSPPRELSQRFRDPDVEIIEPRHAVRRGGGVAVDGGGRTDREAERLKRELGRVSKQLNHLEHECMTLQKEKVEKDEQLKCAFSQIQAKNTEIQNLRMEKLEASKQSLSRPPLQLQNSGAYANQADQGRMDENKCLWGASVPERTTEIYNGKSAGANEPSVELALDYKSNGSKRKNSQTDGVCAVSELKRRNRIQTEHGLTTSRQGSAMESSCCETPVHLMCKTVGVQTDADQEHSHSASEDVSLEHNIGSQLLAIWGSSVSGSPYYKRRGRDMVSKLFVTCSTDISVLFRSMAIVSENNLGFRADKSSSEMSLLYGMQSVQSTDTTKVSWLYMVLMKMNNEIEELPHLFEALLDLCSSDNISVVHRSLRILHAVLQHLLRCNIIAHKRKNILAGQPLQGVNYKECEGLQNQSLDTLVHEKVYTKPETSGSVIANTEQFHLDKTWKDESESSHFTSLSSEDFVTLFESMRQIAARYSEEYIRVEVVAIMNLILMRSNPYLERQKFELMPLLDTLSHLLKESGLCVRREVVRMLFLLLNSPKMLMMLCCGGKESTEHTEIADIQKDLSGPEREISCILNPLLECLSCSGSGAQELKLRREVITLFAYIAAYGKPGFKILVQSVTSHGVNFLELVIRVLASEMEAETANSAGAQALSKDRLSLMREALILLNRLASHPDYSKATLGALTSNNATASLTADVANRISHISSGCWKQSRTKRTKLGVEVVDLAQLFKTRVCAFLGEKHTSTS